ncbi:LuxR C-terminal-related transcriptional regulator [Pseudomonas sp. LA21]|uniref:helix-turn-helix transcriptional regulator n=1 Tax=Pseudomonas sp. LA21 TaxID=2893373 RepID=UPI001FB859E9|nr:LuxR C-terminal-related transcriptional regulator [Pseudomonas sp. LA21]MCJ1886937.1 LuxR C-terminal-related transcriptional regulator [Pseudomonas sp. LA21]
MSSFPAIAAGTPVSVSASPLPREHLLQALLESPRRLNLLCAPAGYGKSALARAALERLPASCARLWLDCAGQPLGVTAACAQIARGLGLAESDPANVLLALQLRRQPLWLVLDDYPQEADGELDAWIQRLLGLTDVPLHLLVSCRQRPDWNLSRLLLEERLCELGATQLAFSREECDALALAQGYDTECCERLWAATLGWCAGARLLLSARDGVHAPGEVASWLRAYLTQELLGRLDAESAAMLCGLAYLPRFNRDICAGLWEEQGGEHFDRLHNGQGFFLALDADASCFRLPPLVAKALQGHLQGPALTRLRLRACGVLGQAGWLDEAIELALGAGQPEVAASYMDRLDMDWLFAGRHLRLLLDWREKLPPALMESTPRLICLNARALLFSWRLDEAEACIERLGNFLPQAQAPRNRRLLANWLALRGALDGMRGRLDEARERCNAALEELEPRDWRSVLLCQTTLARLSMAGGQPQAARRTLQDAVELARRRGCLASEVLLDCDRIRLALLGGDAGQAQALLDACCERVAATGQEHGLLIGRLAFLRGELQLLQGDTAGAQASLERGVVQARACADPYILHGLLGLAEVASRGGDSLGAGRAAEEAERYMHRWRVQPACYALPLQGLRLRLLARQGQWQRLHQEGQALATEPLVAPLHTPSLPQRLRYLLALAQAGCGDIGAARERLRCLQDECQRLELCGLAREAQHALDSLASGLPAEQLPGLLPAAPAGAAEGCGHGLTAREVAVLRLLAEGLSNQEIGNSLFISLNTVKTHTKKINVKLGVRRRTQAIVRAKSLGLLG